MGTRVKTTPRKTASTKVPRKKRFGNATPAPNQFRKAATSARNRKPVAFHNREIGTR